MRVGIIIPALNEDETIAAVVAAVAPYGLVVVVDDGSHDLTAERARAAGAEVVRHPVNRGYDRALATGFVYAETLGVDAVVTFDADGQHDPAILGRLLAPLAAGTADLVLGFRPRPARLAEWLFSVYGRLRFGLRDPLCGLKAFSISTYRRYREMASRQSINTAIAFAALRARARFGVIAVPIRPRAGRSRFGSTLRADGRILAALGGAIRDDLRSLRGRRR